jgi:GNAT superfamily N-acetyltransferase
MGNTGILKAHQGRGIYTSLLPHIIQILRQKGFQLISSKHHASNNRVLIPKLKAGFQITGMEIDDRYGIFVVLSYYLSERRLQFYHFRTGFQRPNEEIKKHL